jgi:EAL domain-containing protein (putative c-di-GMP-specific phosphodiesterase class I)
MRDPDVLARVEKLHTKVSALAAKAMMAEQKERATYAARYLQALAETLVEDKPCFIVETWHPLWKNLPLDSAGEMLLRVKERNGNPLPPYPAVMTFYHNGFTEEMDAILCLCALNQYKYGSEKQVSINVSGRSLLNNDFVKAILAKIESLKLNRFQKIILEIHESNAVVTIPPKIISMFRKLDVGFAMDDVGLSMNDVLRLSAFENVADYIKLDRQCVSAHPEDPRALPHILSLANSLLPNAQFVAEGVQSTDHAREILTNHPNIRYIQGMHLPERDEFARQWKEKNAQAQV